MMADLAKDYHDRRKDKMKSKNGFVQNIETLALDNNDFRRVLFTARHCQLVVMSLKPGEDIGLEVHELDQFLRIEEGAGECVLNGERSTIGDGSAIIVPAGVEHNIINTGTVPMKLYTVYAPPEHRDGVIHRTRAEAEANEEHFDGKTSVD
jgi:mannose-6-phosphate isomerase-like protein (cupin superfamily)